MSAIAILIITICILMIWLFAGGWVFLALGSAGVVGLILLGGPNMLTVIGPTTWGSVYNVNLSAVPLFIFMGELILQSGISDNLYNGASKWFGPLPGGLLHTNVASCALFAAVSGSSVATTATIGSVALPSLKSRGYERKLILGSIAASGTLGILIPPSINMIVYGAWVECSIGQLFAGGLIPGIIMALFFMVYITIRVKKNPDLAPKESSSWKERLIGFRDMSPILFVMVFIFTTIYTGIMTPTETAGVASFIVIILILVMRRFSWRLLHNSTLLALRITCMVLFIFIGAKILIFVLAFGGLPSKIPLLIANLGFSRLQVLFLLYSIYLILGCFMDGVSMIVLTMHFVVPILFAYNISLVWFGVALIILTEMGMLTPPMGMGLYVMLGLDRTITLGEVTKSIVPFLLIQAGVILLITFVPILVLFLPSKMTL